MCELYIFTQQEGKKLFLEGGGRAMIFVPTGEKIANCTFLM